MLIYLNGHNELEPEMWQAKLNLERARPSSQVSVLVQIGRENRELARLLRPGDMIPQADEEWTGVRRYEVHHGCSELVADLGTPNLADPLQLQTFIRWGLTNYPAERTMLAIGGHAISVVGLMTDYSQDRPYTMGLPGLAAALAGGPEGRGIDLLALDTCNANSAEVLYELAQGRNPSVRTVITFTGGAPLRGLPYHELASALGDCYGDLRGLHHRLLAVAGASSVALRVDPVCLEQVKSLANRIAEDALNEHGQGSGLGPPGPELVDSRAREQLSEAMRPLVALYRPPVKGPLITLVAARLPGLLVEPYGKLAFAKGNRWFDLLAGDSSGSAPRGNECVSRLAPLELPVAAAYACIMRMNPRGFNAESAHRILRHLWAHKKWTTASQDHFGTVRVASPPNTLRLERAQVP